MTPRQLHAVLDLLRQCLANAGVPGPLDGAIVFVVPLPGDRMLGVASEAIRAIGIAFTVVTGHVAWACASFQSLMHDKLIGKMGKLIEKVAAESVHAAAQAACAPTKTTGQVTVDAEPVSISKAAADKATPPVSAPRSEGHRAPGALDPTTSPWTGPRARRVITESEDARAPGQINLLCAAMMARCLLSGAAPNGGSRSL